MKFLHLADLHLGKRVNGFSMLEDQAHILRQILAILDDEQPDGVLIAGDVYDKSVPSVEAVGLLDGFLTELRARGVWITGTAADADRTLFEADLTGPVAICIGSEGEGISRLLKEKCDFLVSIPMEGQTESLNASVAGALCMYEVLRTRKGLR